MSSFYNNHIFDDIVYINNDELIKAPHITNNINNHSNNGLITSIWGPHGWEYGHSVTFGYPIKPTQEDKDNYYNFFIYFGKTLPCSLCVKSYAKFILEKDTLLDIKVLESRKTLTQWLYKIHNKVNKKLGVKYNVTYEELCYKYESYRAKCIKTSKGCLMPLDDKAQSYSKAKIKRAPIIDITYSNRLREYALLLNIDYYDKFLNYYGKAKRNSKQWMERDILARKIIDHIKINGISSLDDNNMPTKYEVILISLRSSTLDKQKLDSILQNL